nr:SH2 domain-containing protein A isoform X2 [Tanacetum cinerariifolium]
DPPVQLHFDATSATDVEVDSGGVWTVVGGKASSRRYFSLTVVLKDAFGRSVNKEMELVAKLTYADNGAHVEKLDGAEAPLLTCKDGVEFASWDKPTRLISGHVSFRLWISQLSSQCDNRLFRIKFNVFKMGRRYPFLEAFSRPIRCILPNLVPNPRTSTLIWKQSTSAIHTFNGPSWLNGGTMEPVNNIVHEAKLTPLSKRIKLGQANSVVNVKPDNVLKQPDVVRHEDGRLNGRTLDGKQETHQRACNLLTDSDSIEAANTCKSLGSNGSPVSDLSVFKYCLGTLNEKYLLLKDLVTSASEKEVMDFAEQAHSFLGFPTSRSWPHPDAGNLIITYVGSDFAIHHRLLSLDFFHSCGGKSLKDMLLEERELSRLGRITSRSLRLV